MVYVQISLRKSPTCAEQHFRTLEGVWGGVAPPDMSYLNQSSHNLFWSDFQSFENSTVIWNVSVCENVPVCHFVRSVSPNQTNLFYCSVFGFNSSPDLSVGAYCISVPLSWPPTGKSIHVDTVIPIEATLLYESKCSSNALKSDVQSSSCNAVVNLCIWGRKREMALSQKGFVEPEPTTSRVMVKTSQQSNRGRVASCAKDFINNNGCEGDRGWVSFLLGPIWAEQAEDVGGQSGWLEQDLSWSTVNHLA